MTTRRSNVSRNAGKLWQGFIAMALVAAVVFSTPTTAGATSASAGSLEALEAADIDISYTAASDRSGPALLDGAAISGSISTFVTPLEPDGDIKRVEFSLDGVLSHTEFAAPYDWPARARGAWDSSSVTDGSHTLSIDVHLGDGSIVSKTATFTVSNGVTPVDSGLAYSDDIGRGDNLDLNGAVVDGTIWAYVFPTHPARQLGIQNVSFTLNGDDFRAEFLAPYDFAPAAAGWDTTSVADGEHTIVATANGSDGIVFTSTATFTVANDGPPPTDPDGEDPDDGEDPNGEDPDGEDPDGEDPDGEDPDGEDPDGDSSEPFDAADGMVIGRTGTLNGLNGLYIGPDGNVYVSSVAGSEITVHDPETGDILDRIRSERGVFGPDDVFITPDGTIYWTELLAGNVGMLKPDGTFKTQFVGPGVNPITMSDDGRLFVARDFLGDGLYELDPELEAEPIVLIPDIAGLNGMDFGPDGLLYGPLFFSSVIVRIDVDAATPAAEVVVDGLDVPAAVKFNSAGELHVALLGGGQILKIDLDTGTNEVLAQIEGSIDNLAFDANDRLFFTAGADNQIYRITPGGATDVFGEISLTLPGGIAVGPDGTIWVADLFSLRGYQDGADPVASYYDSFAPPGTAFGGANTVSAYGDLLVTSSAFGANAQVFNPATGEVLEDFRTLVFPTNAIAHGDVIVASQLGINPGDANVVDARTGEVLLGGLALPVGLASDGTTLYVGDWALGTVTAVDAAGSTVIASGLTNPEGLAVDGDRLLVVEEGLDQVSAIDLATGEITPVIVGLDIGTPPLPGFSPHGSPTGVTVDADGTIYVTQDGETNAALKFPAGPSDPDGEDPDGEDPDGEDPDGEDPTLGLLETLAADGRFTTLVELFGEATFDPPPPDLDFTIFAPTDDAFAALPAGVLDEIRANPDALNDALLYHVVEGTLLAETLATTPEIFSVSGVPIGVELVGETIVLNGNVNVAEADILATDGVIHAVDAVLTPPQRDFLAFLVADYARGSTEVPDPGDLSTWSQGFFEVFDVDGEEHEVCVSAGTIIADPTVAHIHRGKAGESGPVVVDTGFSAESWEVDEVFTEERYAQSCVPVEAGLVAEILASPGDFYFNVHSESFPGGANREQLFDGATVSNVFGPRSFTAAPLLGSNEVPGPGDPDSGRSFIDFSLPTTDNGELCFTAVLFNVDGITAAHIHEGAAGVSGDVVVDLQAVSRWRVTPETPLWHWFRGCVPVEADVLAQIQANPEGFYANFHNEAYPDGAVRAQLVEGVGEEARFAELAPESGFDPEMNGFANTVLFPSQGQFCWEINALGVGMPTSASISGPNGLTIDLDLTTYPFRAIAVPWSDYTSHGCQVVDEAVLDDIVANPDSYLVSIDTALGALSGSLFNPETGPLPVDPPPEEDPDGEDPTLGLLETLAADGRFTTLVELFGEATFDPPPPDLDFTIFAPTDDAFAALPEGVLDEIRANPDALNDALLYHVVEGTLLAEALATTPELFAVNGAPIGVELVGDTVVLNGNVNVTEADILATDGVVHAVDAVLQPPQRDFLAILVADFARGSTEVPGPGDPDSLSQAFIEVFDVEGDDHELCVNTNTTVADATAAHLHAGAAGVEGGVVVNFGLDASSWAPNEFAPTYLEAQTCVPVEAGLAEQIVASPGDYYFNVHSETFPGGANREQLLDAEGLNEFPRAFTAAPLLGSNEVPGPGGPGLGWIDFSLPITDNDELCFRSATNVNGLSAAHIHAGAAGSAGDVVVNLEVGSRWPINPDVSGLGDFIEGCSPIDPDVQTQIEADPSAFYANFHSETFPAGAVRAQLVAGVGEIPLIAEMEPAGGGSPEVNGFAVLTLFPSQGQLCWGSDATGVGQPTGLSILGPEGFTIELDLATYPFQANASPFAELSSDGCQAVDQAVQEAMIANPDAYSVSTDTADGDGALTGSLFDPFTGPAGPPPDSDAPDVEALIASGSSARAYRVLQFSSLSGR